MAALVSIGIPTYNRAELLARAVDSARRQTHRELEIVIGDNASSDGTRELCARIAAADARVIVHRRPRNIGPIANFNAVLRAMRGDYILLLADDDALEPDLVERCLAELTVDPGLSVAQGRTRYVGQLDDSLGGDFDVIADDRSRRVLRYLASVYDNGALYGLGRGRAVRSAMPLPNMLGADWVWGARLMFQGGLRVTQHAALVRSYGGASVSYERIADVLGLPARAARHPLPAIIAGVHRDIASRSPVYAPLGPAGRHTLAIRAVATLLRKHAGDLAWDELHPLLARPGVARAAEPVRRLVRRVRPYRAPPMRQPSDVERRS